MYGFLPPEVCLVWGLSELFDESCDFSLFDDFGDSPVLDNFADSAVLDVSDNADDAEFNASQNPVFIPWSTLFTPDNRSKNDENQKLFQKLIFFTKDDVAVWKKSPNIH